MPDMTFTTPQGQTIAREMLILYLNTGSSATPTWSPIGSRVTDSSMSLDWSLNSNTDILGKTHNSMKKPVITQSFDPMPLVSGDPAHEYLWNLAIREQNPQALSALDVLIVHFYAGTSTTVNEVTTTTKFAERYSACAMNVTGLGGSGGGEITMPGEITLGGTRTTGTASLSGTTVTFSADS